MPRRISHETNEEKGMKIHRRHALLGLAGMAAASNLSAAIAKGDTAPDIELPSTKGGTEKISAYRGKKNVVLAFYPKAFTGG
jgi:hypothetical protein